jgi:phosphoribosylanthranilate isomerase
MVKIKICGLTRFCDIDAVNEVDPDYIGFVFAESRRRVTPQQALELRNKLCSNIIPVGVFIREPIENIVSLVKNGTIDAIQLHGQEDERYIQKLKALTDKPIIKAITIQDEKLTAADCLMFDNRDGGTGQVFDWNLIGKTDKPFFLAGGLYIENVEQAIKNVKPFAVDVSSGVETNGFKDFVKIKEFVERVRNG